MAIRTLLPNMKLNGRMTVLSTDKKRELELLLFGMIRNVACRCWVAGYVVEYSVRGISCVRKADFISM